MENTDTGKNTEIQTANQVKNNTQDNSHVFLDIRLKGTRTDTTTKVEVSNDLLDNIYRFFKGTL